jgi:hypothetical protein
LTPLVRYDTAGAGDLEFERLWLPLKGISIEKIYIGKLYYPIYITITQKYRGYLRIIFGSSGVIDTAFAKIGDLIVKNIIIRKLGLQCVQTITARLLQFCLKSTSFCTIIRMEMCCGAARSHTILTAPES